MNQLQEIRHWFYSLAPKERLILSITTIIVIITIFFLTVWEPLHLGLDTERTKQKTQNKNVTWMQQAANDVKTIRRSGSPTTLRDKNKPTTLVIEQSINNAGLKSSVSKIESSGKDGARVTLNEASFNQILVWISTLSKYNGIHATSANIERAKSPGKANARLTFERS